MVLVPVGPGGASGLKANFPSVEVGGLKLHLWMRWEISFLEYAEHRL